MTYATSTSMNVPRKYNTVKTDTPDYLLAILSLYSSKSDGSCLMCLPSVVLPPRLALISLPSIFPQIIRCRRLQSAFSAISTTSAVGWRRSVGRRWLARRGAGWGHRRRGRQGGLHAGAAAPSLASNAPRWHQRQFFLRPSLGLRPHLEDATGYGAPGSIFFFPTPILPSG